MTEPSPVPAGREEQIDAAALYGLNFALEREGSDPRSVVVYCADKARIAQIVAAHAIRAGQFVTPEDHRAALAVEREKTERWKRHWALAGIERDRTLSRAQVALSALPDKALAAGLAVAIGVLLLPEERAS